MVVSFVYLEIKLHYRVYKILKIHKWQIDPPNIGTIQKMPPLLDHELVD